MTVLVSDRARAQIGAKVLDLLRTYMIDSRQSEPHNKNENFTELGWRDKKNTVQQSAQEIRSSKEMLVPCSKTCMHANEPCCTREPGLENGP